MPYFGFGRTSKYVIASVLVVTVLLTCGVAGADTAFSPKRDAFSISNAPGWCFAMAAFSRWYYLTHQDEAPLRQVLSKKAQQLIARELQEFYSRNLIKIQADYCNKNHKNPRESLRSLLTGLVSGEPRIVLLMNRGPRGAVLHAVLAYGWMPEHNMLRIYDPNYRNEERFIDLEREEYTSLDITYHAICFPEVLDNHPALARHMERLYASCVTPRAQASAGPIADPHGRRAQATR